MEELNLEMSNAERQSIINPVTPELPEEQPELPPAPQVEQVESSEERFEGEKPEIDPAAFAGVRSVGFSEEQDAVIMGEAEGAAAVPLGPVDFGIDALYALSKGQIDIPKPPEFENEAFQAIRNISGLILPSIWLGGLTTAGGVGAQSAMLRAAGRGNVPAKYLSRLGADKLFEKFALLGITFGAGGAVDQIHKVNQEDDTFATWLKDKLPERFKFMIPAHLETLPSDSADIRQKKNVLEGMTFNAVAELLPAAAKFFHALKRKDEALQFVGKNAQGDAFQKRLDEAATRETLELEAMGMMEAAQTGDDLLDAAEIARESYERAMLLRADDLDEMAAYSRATSSLDEPMLGVNRDAYSMHEEAALTVDDLGAAGAAADQARIVKNDGTVHGRLRNMISETALRAGINVDELTRRTLLNSVKQTLEDAGHYDLGKTKWKDIDKASTELAEYLIDPLADGPFIKELLKDYKQITRSVENLDDIGLAAVTKALRYWTDEFFNLDAMKASALLQTSTAGQIADIAEGARLFDSPETIANAQRMIIDRMELMTHEKQVANYLRGSALNFVNVFNRLWKGHKKWRNPKAASEAMIREAESLGLKAEGAILNAAQKNKQYFNELRELAKENPEFLRPFMLANELTDGDVHSMYRFNEYMKGSMSVFRKLIFNADPKVQSMINNGVMSNVYNSLLSAPRTPAIAALSNTAMLLQKPANVMAGSMVRGITSGDWDQVKRGWYTYRAFAETMQEGFRHMALVWNKSVQNPDAVPYVMRENHYVLDGQRMELMEETAKSAEEQGNFGVRYFVNMMRDLRDLQNHPVARWGTNALGALDGFGRGVIANGIARSRSYDEGIKFGDMRPESLKASRDNYFKEMQNDEGFILDPEVEFSAREVSMSLDHPVVDAVTALINYIPAIKPFFMFNRTGINVLGAAWNHSPLSAFVGDYHEIVGFPGYKHSEDEIRQIFQKRGMTIDENMGTKFRALQAEMQGRVAVSTAITFGIVNMVLADACHGDGHMNPAVQRVRDKLKWARRSCQSPVDGNWYSYEGLGPVGDHVALVTNITDNFDQLGLAETEKLLQKSTFVLASSLTDRTAMAGVEPFFKILGGRPEDLARFGAQNLNALFPLAGMRNAFGKLLSEGDREMNNDLMDGIKNRNRYLDVLDQKGTLPAKYSWIDGELVGGDLSMFERLFNFVSPIQVSPGLSPEKQFLIDIEYDSTPSWLRSSKGHEYTPEQRSEVASLMGEDGFFKRELNRIMRKYKDKDWINKIQDLRGKPFMIDPRNGQMRTGFSSEEVDVTLYDGLYNEIDRVLAIAKQRAENLMTDRDAIRRTRIDFDVNKARQLQGKLPLLKNK